MTRFWLLLPLTLAPIAGAVDFSHEVVPILKKHCVECHAGEKKKGGLSMNSRADLIAGSENGPVIDPKTPGKSVLLDVITTKDADLRMPPKGPGLSKEEIQIITTWIREGLPWQDGFAFKKPAYEPPLKPRRPTLPAPRKPERSHPIDRILDHYLATQKLPTPPPISDAAFARRSSLDLTGLLPEVIALEAFLADRSPNKRTTWLQNLLNDDTAYAEHWLTFWNDLLRNDYGGTGFITGGRKQVSKWLYHSLIENHPYDQMARELIAPVGEESRGFIDGIKWRGDVSAGQTVEIQFAQSVGQSFLGINMKCASCHDSFVDRWKLSEAYGLAAIYATRPLEIARCDKPTGELAKASWLFPEIGQVDPNAAQPSRLKQLADLMTHPENGRFSRTLVNRLWHRLLGHGIVHPLDSMQSPPWSADLLDHLATYFSDEHFDLKKTLLYIASSQAYQSQVEIQKTAISDESYRYRGPRTKRLTAEQFVDALWNLTGAAPEKMDAPLMRGKVDAELAKNIKPQGQWIWTDKALHQPPAAGERILLRKTLKLTSAPDSASAVVTADNSFQLYVNGRLISSGQDWSRIESVALHAALKEGANQIVVIAENAGNKPNAAGMYFEARLKYKDKAEQTLVSDASWEFHTAAPANKEGRLGQVPAKGWKPAAIVPTIPAWSQVIQRDAPALLAQASHKTDRPIRASLLKSDFLMRTLGRPNRDQIVSMRPDDLTTLEALDLANGAILTSTLQKGAKKWILEKRWQDLPAFLDWLFPATLARSITTDEKANFVQILGTTVTEQTLADAFWAVLMLPEFQRVH